MTYAPAMFSSASRAAIRRLAAVSLLGAVLLSGCKPPVAPMVMNCEDDYSPASCLDGEEECETDDEGCRVCRCVRDDD